MTSYKHTHTPQHKHISRQGHGAPRLFQQDGAPAHTAKSTTEWLRKKGVIRLNGGIWPAMSPDMNPVEHIWPIVLRDLEGQVFSGREALWSALEASFARIPPADVCNLYGSMARRMAAVMANKATPSTEVPWEAPGTI